MECCEGGVKGERDGLDKEGEEVEEKGKSKKVKRVMCECVVISSMQY